MALKVEVISDVSKVLADAATMADRYDDVSDTLKDLAKAGESAGDRIESAFTAGVSEAQDLKRKTDAAADEVKDLGKAGKVAGDQLEKGLKDGETAAKDLAAKSDAAFDKISADARAAGKQVGKSSKDGFDEASEGAETFKENAGANAKEVAASFDGSIESIADGFQGLFAEMLEGFGPAGLAAGVAVAAGLGLAISAMTETAAAATESKQKSVDMIDAIAEAGGNLADMDLADKIKSWGREVLEDNWITFWADESSTKFQETAKDAKDAGVTIRDAIRAGAGSADESRKFLDSTGKAWQDLTKKIEAGTTYGQMGERQLDASAAAAEKQRNALSDLRGQAEDNIKTTENAVEIYGLETDALGETKEAADKAAQAIKDKADASSAAADAAMDLVGAENDYVETVKSANDDIKANGRTLDMNTKAGRANAETLVELAKSANGYRDSAIEAGDSTEFVTAKVQRGRDSFIAAAEAAGYGAKEAAELADKYGLIPGNVETLVKANGTEEAKAKIDGIPDAKKTAVEVTATGTGQAQETIDGIQGKTAEVKAEATGTDTTQAAIESVKGKDVKIDVDDDYTVSEVQKRIDGIKGRDVGVTVRLTNEPEIRRLLEDITAPRTAYVTIQERPGKPVV